MEKTLIISSLMFSALMTLFLAGYASIKLRRSGFWAYSLYMLSITFYSSGYAFELSSTTFESILAAIKLEYPGISFLPVFRVMFASSYTNLTFSI